MSRIKRIFVRNLRNINAAEVDTNGCSIIVFAGNDKGKSTLLRSFIDRAKGIKQEDIVRRGQRDGMYEMELTSGEVFRWHIDKNGKEKLLYIGTNGKIEKLTSDMRSYFFPQSFDVDKFLNETPAKQRAIMFKICGIDFTEIDKEIDHAIDQRKLQSRLLDEAKALEITFKDG